MAPPIQLFWGSPPHFEAILLTIFLSTCLAGAAFIDGQLRSLSLFLIVVFLDGPGGGGTGWWQVSWRVRKVFFAWFADCGFGVGRVWHVWKPALGFSAHADETYRVPAGCGGFWGRVVMGFRQVAGFLDEGTAGCAGVAEIPEDVRDHRSKRKIFGYVRHPGVSGCRGSLWIFDFSDFHGKIIISRGILVSFGSPDGGIVYEVYGQIYLLKFELGRRANVVFSVTVWLFCTRK
ncbi:hypothetical protein C8J57DRAFT_1241275 [Mycena rebaudengoi]|nr:hypothetical protein C8J57DRAFT_1241275 [Mycena rebaudengoi]